MEAIEGHRVRINADKASFSRQSSSNGGRRRNSAAVATHHAGTSPPLAMSQDLSSGRHASASVSTVGSQDDGKGRSQGASRYVFQQRTTTPTDHGGISEEGEGGVRRGLKVISRVHRACNACRKQKVCVSGIGAW